MERLNSIGCVVNTDECSKNEPVTTECSKNEPVTTDSKHLLSNEAYP